MRRKHLFIVAVFLVGSACPKNDSKPNADGDISIGNANSGGTARDSSSSGGAMRPTGGSSTSGIGTGGEPGVGGATGGAQSAGIDASVSGDANVPQCSESFSRYSMVVCAIDGLPASRIPSQYSGTVLAAASLDENQDAGLQDCGIQYQDFSQYAGRSLTLALLDGGTVEIVYGSSAATPLPSLAARVGRQVSVDVLPYFDVGYAAGASLVIRDETGLVLAAKMGRGGSTSSQTVETITVSPGPGICVSYCEHLERELLFAGTTVVSLSPGHSGSFTDGASRLTALALAWSEKQSPTACADGYSWSAWAIWREAP